MMDLFGNEWKKMFKKRILERGWDYYESGMVRDAKPTIQGYTAVVDGTDAYTVDIIVEDGYVVEMFCDCPYAEEGNYCKHMAAVMYEITEEYCGKYKQLYEENQKKEQQELVDIIAKIPEIELRALFLELAMNNSDVRSKVLASCAGRIDEQCMRELKEEIYRLGDEYADRSGFIDWESAYDYTCELGNYIWNIVEKLLVNGHCMQALELVNEAFCEAASQDMDDSDGGLTQLAYNCYELWKQILEKCNAEQQKEMFEVMKNSFKNPGLDEIVRDYMSDFLMNEFHDESVLKEKLEFLDKEIERLLKNHREGYFDRYHLEDTILARIRLMVELKCSENEIIEYRSEYREFPAVRRLEVEMYLEAGNLQAAIEILKESKEIDKEFPGLVDGYSRQLMEIYENCGRKDEYKQELLYYVFQCIQNNLEYIFKLKAIVSSDEWKEYCEKILTSRTCMQIRYDFLKKEKLYERLLEEILKEEYIIYLDHYEDVLGKRFPILVRDRYISYVKQDVKRASERKMYQNLMCYLKKIKRYPGGLELAQKIAAEWRTEYRRRPAMMDELDKAGL